MLSLNSLYSTWFKQQFLYFVGADNIRQFSLTGGYYPPLRCCHCSL